jgi:hypothetical protein
VRPSWSTNRPGSSKFSAPSIPFLPDGADPANNHGSAASGAAVGPNELRIEHLLVHNAKKVQDVIPFRTMASFYRTAAGAEIDLVLEFPGLPEKWAIEIKRGFSVSLTNGFYNAVEDVRPDKTFVVYAGEDRYPLAEGVEAIGVAQMEQILIEKSGE